MGRPSEFHRKTKGFDEYSSPAHYRLTHKNGSARPTYADVTRGTTTRASSAYNNDHEFA